MAMPQNNRNMKKIYWIAALIFLLCIVWLLGPKPNTPHYINILPQVPPAEQIDGYISELEKSHQIKPENEAKVEWFEDSSGRITEYSIVYLHGFSSSREEGAPVHRNLAKKFGCNLFLSRLAEHGIDTTEQLMGLTPENYWESAVKALAIGKSIGKKVILMGTSTGATQALQLAASFPNEVAGLILYSPNIEINDPNAWLLNEHWGLQIARMVKQSDYNDPPDPRPIYKKYWNKPYRLESLVALQEMLETTMKKEQFEKVNQPLLMLYYYSDEQHQDPVVRVDAMKKMFGQISTPSNLKKQVALPLTGDHVIASPIKSKDVAGVERETIEFMSQIMKLPTIH